MHVLLISDRYFPDNSGTSMRSQSLAQGVLSLGVDITVATLTHRASLGENDGYKNPRIEIIDGVRVYRFKSQIALLLGMFKIIRKHKCQLIHARGPRYGLFAYLLNLVLRVPYILELSYILEQKSFFRNYLLSLVIHSAARIVVLSQCASNWALKNLGITADKIDVVINGIDIDKFDPNKYTDKKINLSIGQNLVVGYIGSFYEWQGIFNFVKIAKILCDQRNDIKFLMIGDGPDLGSTIELAKELKIYDKVIFTGNVSNQEIPSFLKTIDIFLVVRPPYLINQIAVPLKLFEAMAMEKAIIVTPAEPLVEIIRNEKTGIISSYDVQDIADKALMLLQDAPLRRFLGENARLDVISKFSWVQVSILLSESYKRVIKE